MTAYPANMAGHVACRSLEQVLADLVERHERLSAALRKGTRIANTKTLDELRGLHSRIRALEDEIDARSP